VRAGDPPKKKKELYLKWLSSHQLFVLPKHTSKLNLVWNKLDFPYLAVGVVNTCTRDPNAYISVRT
jgi:hypothetical protein